MKRVLLLSISFLQISLLLFAQDNNVTFSYLSTRDGLTQNPVSFIYQDSIGFLWFGTEDGLNRYNGYYFDHYRAALGQQKGLTSNYITDICEDKNGIFWIGANAGLTRYDSRYESYERVFSIGKDKDAESDYIVSLCHSNAGILIGTHSGIFLANYFSDSIHIRKFTPEDSETHGNLEVFCFINPSDNNFLAATNQGLFALNLSKLRYDKQEIRIDGKLFEGMIYRSYKDSASRIWIISEEGISVSKRKYMSNIYTGKGIIEVQNIPRLTRAWKESGNNPVTSVMEFDKGIIWFSTLGKGILTYNVYDNSVDRIRFKERDGALNNDFVLSMKKDRSGTTWVGTDAGINCFDPHKSKFAHINSDPFDESGPAFRNLHAILDDEQGKIWIGTKSSGMFVIDTKNQITTQYINDEVINNAQVRTFIKDRQGLVWAGTGKGITVLKNKGNTIEDITKELIPEIELKKLREILVYSLVEDENENIWIGSEKGLFYFERNSGKVHDFKFSGIGNALQDKSVYTLYMDSRNRIWVGTINGPSGVIYHYKYSNEDVVLKNPEELYIFSPVKLPSPFGDHVNILNCYSILELSNHQILFGTNLGLFRIDPVNYELIKPDFPDNVPAGLIYGILEGEMGYLWISSNSGIVKYDPVNNSAINYTMSDGLQGMDFNGGASHQNKTGTMFFGGPNGLNIFHPESVLLQNSYDPPVVILRLLINGQEVSINDRSKVLNASILYTEEVTIKKIQNSVGIEFASLHLASPEDNHFEYSMSKITDNWVSSQNRNLVTFSNLSRGHYTFKVRGTNNDGKAGSAVRVMHIRVKPAWYESPLAIVIYILSIIAFVLFLRRNTVKRIELIKTIEMEKLEKLKSDELYEAKLKFFTNISHEFRTPLTLILAPIESLLKSYQSDPTLGEYLGIIGKNAKRLLRLVNQVLDFRKASSDNLTLLVSEDNICSSIKSIAENFDLIADQKNVEFKIISEKSTIKVTYDEDKLEKTLFNLLSNAFTAVDKTGCISIHIQERPSFEKNEYVGYKMIGEVNEYILNKGYVEIKVSDNGSGLEEDAEDKLFEKFYQGKTISSGTGIGLYLVKKFTLLHKGLVFFKSEKGKGTTFIISYPLGNGHFTKDQLTGRHKRYSHSLLDHQISLEHTDELIQESSSPEKKYKLIIVEDDLQMGNYLKKELKEYEVSLFNDGKKGLESAVHLLPDLIISDILMPGLNGLELCRKIKQDILTSHIPVILLSAKAMDSNIVEGLETGADSYIAKPFNIEILKATVSNLIKRNENLKTGITNISGFDFKDSNISSVDEVFLNNLKSLIEQNLDNSDYNVELLASDLGMSRTQLFRKMKALTGQSYISFIRTLRLQKAARLLKTKKMNVSEIAFSVGFSDPKYFSKIFKQEFGLSPTDYQIDS